MPKLVTDEQIFKAVVEVLVAHGYAGATTRQIAAAAKVNEVTLFRKFGNKAQLVVAAVRHGTDAVSLWEAIRYTGDVAADLLCIVRAYTSTATQRSKLFPIILSEIPRHPELRQVLEVPHEAMAGIGELLGRYQAEGVLYTEHPQHAVAALIGPLMIDAMMRQATNDDFMPPFDLPTYVDMFLKGRRVC